MEKRGAIPQGYLTIGEFAKKMGITVRTLQYYDKKSVFSPSAESEGGRRLYSDKDFVRLHQILSLKRLGFSLDDIKSRLTSLDTPDQVAAALTEQAAEIRKKLEVLSESLKEIEMLKAEVLQMHAVDFKKYADIIVNLQMKNEYYWIIKHFDDQTLDYFRTHFDQQSSSLFIDKFTCLCDEIIQLQKNGAAPDSEQGQRMAKKFWEMVMEITKGDPAILPKLMEIPGVAVTDSEWGRKQALVNAFIEPALDAYFTKLGFNPFEEASE